MDLSWESQRDARSERPLERSHSAATSNEAGRTFNPRQAALSALLHGRALVEGLTEVPSEFVRIMGSTGDPPVPVGDSPNGRARRQLHRSDLFVANGLESG